MKSATIMIILIVGMIGFCLVPLFITENIEAKLNDPQPLGLDPPITIVSNLDFASQAATYGWPGTGSPGTPYLIKDKIIQSGGINETGIEIKGTTVHFIILNCEINNSKYNIYFSNVQNGVIQGCNISNNEIEGIGIWIKSGSNNDVIGNNVTTPYIDLLLQLSSYTDVYYNNFNHTGTNWSVSASGPNNYIHDNHGSGEMFIAGANDLKIYGNFIEQLDSTNKYGVITLAVQDGDDPRVRSVDRPVFNGLLELIADYFPRLERLLSLIIQ